MRLVPVRPSYLRRRLLARVVLLFVFLFVLGAFLCFPVLSCLVLPVINRYRFPASCRKMRTQRLSSCVLAADKLCRVLLLNLSRCANVNTSCAARSFGSSPFHKSSAVWYAGSAAHASHSPHKLRPPLGRGGHKKRQPKELFFLDIYSTHDSDITKKTVFYATCCFS